MKLVSVEPVRKRRSLAFVDWAGGGDLRQVESATYPASPRGRALRDARVDASVSLGDLARKLGIRAVELCKLEHGELTTDEAGWTECFAAVSREGMWDAACASRSRRSTRNRR
jgi:hypothetical protein